ncbi:MAG: IS3 family transposase [Catenibacterium sp.]|uniref:IS3 family transposase n=1 Tax=Catenibacterium sp. TaxID=2049022 RepID=UPI00399417C0
MSRRGNSQDNAPMESFFGRMKTEVIDIIARCGDIDTVRRLIDGYINMHNNERYQDTLATLSPSEFYTYKVTGQYPLDNYYGVKASELMPLDKIIEAKLEMQEKRKQLRKERQKINEHDSPDY